MDKLIIVTKLINFSRTLDTSGGNRDVVARVAGSLRDLAEAIDLRAVQAMDEPPKPKRKAYEAPKMEAAGEVGPITLGTAQPTVGICGHPHGAKR